MDVTGRAARPSAAVLDPRRPGRVLRVLALVALVAGASLCASQAVRVELVGIAQAAEADPAVLATPSQSPQGESPTSSAATEAERRGPDPSGQPVPDRSQRIIDSAVWVWLIACLVVAAALVVRTWRRVPLDPPLLDEQGRARFSAPAAGVPGDAASDVGDSGDPGQH